MSIELGNGHNRFKDISPACGSGVAEEVGVLELAICDETSTTRVLVITIGGLVSGLVVVLSLNEGYS